MDHAELALPREIPASCGNSNPRELSRRELSRRSRREAILEVAARSFFAHGYAATSMSSIAGELGGSKGTLWTYFPPRNCCLRRCSTARPTPSSSS